MADSKSNEPTNATADKPAAPTTSTAAAPAAAAAAAKKSNKTLYIVIGVVVVIFVIIPAILFAAGVAFVGSKVNEAGVKINGNNGTVTVKGKNGDEITAGNTQTLPKDFPSQVPVYKGTIVSSSKLTTDGKTGWTVAITTGDNFTKVSDALTQSFSTNGWTASMDNKSADGGLIAAQNGTLRANLYYSTKDGKTSIVYTVSNVPVE
jgi:hypothetical protein